MKRGYLLILCLLFVVFLSGCMKTYTYQVERKDQDIRGNRGIIMGKVPPAEVGRKRSRTMAGVDVELPPSKEYKQRKRALEEELMEKPVIEEEVAYIEEPEIEPEEVAKEEWIREEVKGEPAAKTVSRPIEYTVRKGDTLQKISKKFYGTTRKWPTIYEENKAAVKHPSRIYPGQVITIPPLAAVEEAVSEEIK